jgi:hypothetical protein
MFTKKVMQENKTKAHLGLLFPQWKGLFVQRAAEFAKDSGLDPNTVKRMVNSYAEKLPDIKNRIIADAPVVIMSTLAKSEGEYEGSLSLPEVLSRIKQSSLSSNEFFVVYDVAEKRYTWVDPAIRTVLGIEPEKFTINSVVGVEPENNLCISEDSPHKVRWAGIAYLILSLPGVRFRSMEEQYSISIRIDTSFSTRSDLVQAGSAVLTKRCYFVFNNDSEKVGFPRYHVDKISIHDKSQFSYVKPSFESNFIQSDYFNTLGYLINCAIIDIDVKYVLMLEEKARQERNKAIAVAMNGYLKEFSKIEKEIPESHVADCFAKTIKAKVEESYNLWQIPANRVKIESDSDAVEYAKKLGIIPIPKNVKELMYKNIDIK